ncbi:MAG: molybdopterin-dependent oxidoreductase [Aliivibrio sp.]|uniref:molybdopterin cofactor-binding domain-containing protein n=1 Tax=Aliivibrio sp. TaxID=1872443 RepID=UPI001A4F1561|nr:molybdopterin-dependent oxidoreductase [Aliivibrio sp.]
MSGFNQIGKRVTRVDGQEKVEGTAIYGNDIQITDMLYGVCRYADIPAGKICKIDITEAKKIPGVVRIACFNDIPGDPTAGVIIRDYLPIVNDEVCFMGDVVAIVAAETYEIACQAVDAIVVEYEPYLPITDVHEALKEDARLIHPDKESNVVAKHHTERGDIDAGLAKADQVIERVYQIGFQEHAYIEPESITAYIDPTNSDVILTGSIQNPHRVRGFVASYLGLNQSKVDVRRAVLGGSFGGKDDTIDHLSCRAGLMALLTKRAVKFTYTREQSIVESSKRHPYHMTYKVGFNRDGKIEGMKINIIADSGAYAACTPFVTWRSVVQAAGPYDIENVRVDVQGVYTNNTYSGAMRGFGSPQIVYANESLMDEIAEICGISSLEVRSINAIKQDGHSITNQQFSNHTVSVDEVLEKAATKSNYLEKIETFKALNASDDPNKYGIGLAISYRGCSMGAEGVDTSSGLVSVNSDGSINISTGVCENGQGLQTTMVMIVAEVFGVELNQISFTEPPTSMISDGGPTVASRATVTGGNAIKQGAETVKTRIFDVISEELSVTSMEQTEWLQGEIRNKSKPELSVTFAYAVNKAKWAGVNLAAYGWFDQPDISWDEEKGSGSPYFTWVYACQVVELKVNISTGKIDLINITAAHDVGQVINQVGFEGQVTGGIAQGFGLGVLEDYNIENGELKSENFDSYLLPTIKDIPNIDIIAIENYDAGGPFGAKSIGEPATELAAAAINNAVSFALNKRFRQLPLTLEQVILGYNLKKPVRQSELLATSEQKKHTQRITGIKLINPESLDHALSIMESGEIKPIAGGTDVLVQARLHTEEKTLVNIAKLEGLCEIVETESDVIIGSGVNFNALVKHPAVQRYFKLLATTAHTIGSNQIRNRATVGGNIVNAAPCADSLPPLIAYNAVVELRSANSVRKMPITDFITGTYRTALEKGELLTRIFIPKHLCRAKLNKTYIEKYSQLGRRNALNITRLSLTCLISFDELGKIDFCHLVDGALFSKPQRLIEVENALLGHPLNAERLDRAEKILLDMIDSAIGGRWSAKYKQPVYLNMFKDLMDEVATQANEEASL